MSPKAREIGWKRGKGNEKTKKSHLCKLHLIAPLRFQAGRAVVLSGWNVNTAISIFIRDCQTSRELIRRRRRWDGIMKEAEGERRRGGVMREPVIRNCLKISFFFFYFASAHDLLSVWMRRSPFFKKELLNNVVLIVYMKTQPIHTCIFYAGIPSRTWKLHLLDLLCEIRRGKLFNVLH